VLTGIFSTVIYCFLKVTEKSGDIHLYTKSPARVQTETLPLYHRELPTNTYPEPVTFNPTLTAPKALKCCCIVYISNNKFLLTLCFWG